MMGLHCEHRFGLYPARPLLLRLSDRPFLHAHTHTHAHTHAHTHTRTHAHTDTHTDTHKKL